MQTLTRSLLEYSCADPSAPDCAAMRCGGCGCARRWAGEALPFPGVGGTEREGWFRRAAEPGVTIGDVAPDELKRRAG